MLLDVAILIQSYKDPRKFLSLLYDPKMPLSLAKARISKIWHINSFPSSFRPLSLSIHPSLSSHFTILVLISSSTTMVRIKTSTNQGKSTHKEIGGRLGSNKEHHSRAVRNKEDHSPSDFDNKVSFLNYKSPWQGNFTWQGCWPFLPRVDNSLSPRPTLRHWLG